MEKNASVGPSYKYSEPLGAFGDGSFPIIVVKLYRNKDSDVVNL